MEYYKLTNNKNTYIDGMKKAVKTLESLFMVKEIENYGFKDEKLSGLSINLWNETMIGTNAKGMKELGIDLYIFGRFATDEEMDSTSSTLASAGANILAEDYQPLIGIVNINKYVDFSLPNSQNYFESIIIHEFTHILGFSSYYFSDVFHLTTTKKGVNGVSRTLLRSPKVLEVAKKYYNCSSIEGVELEDYGGDGTVGSHWEARILLGEYMNGYVYRAEQVISEFTLAALEDLGYYKANYYTGGLMQFRKNKGCEFLNKECIINGRTNAKFGNQFYNDSNGYGPGCSCGRQSRTYRYIGIYNEFLPKEFQYFSNPVNGGPSPEADYCPVGIDRDNNSYYTGSCLRGDGDFGSDLHYYDDTQKHTSTLVSSFFHEEYSKNSFCVISSMIDEKSENSDYYVKNPRPVCYAMFCSEKSLTIKIKEEYFVCPRAGGKIKADGFVGYLLCPDYYLICSGTVMCNEMYDCVDKKSEIKEETYKLDYVSRTKQDIDDADDDDFDEDNYELSEGGKCPQYCTRCNSNGQCIKCTSNYSLVGNKPNKSVICLLSTQIGLGYYKEDSIYYKCMDKCDKCDGESNCSQCKIKFHIVKNILKTLAQNVYHVIN